MLTRGHDIWYSCITYFSSGPIQECFLLASASDTRKGTCQQRWSPFSSFLWLLIVSSVSWKEFGMSSLSEIDPPNVLYHLEHFIWCRTHPAEWVTNRISCLVGWPRYSWVSRQHFEIWCVEQPISNILNHIRPNASQLSFSSNFLPFFIPFPGFVNFTVILLIFLGFHLPRTSIILLILSYGTCVLHRYQPATFRFPSAKPPSYAFINLGGCLLILEGHYLLEVVYLEGIIHRERDTRRLNIDPTDPRYRGARYWIRDNIGSSILLDNVGSDHLPDPWSSNLTST